MSRKYIEESDVGHLFTDAFRSVAGTDIALIHSGSLRKDLPGGEIKKVDLLDTYPFVDDVIIKEVTGVQLLEALEQSFTFERGLLQVSGLKIVYDLAKDKGQRVLSVTHDGKPVLPEDRLTVSMPGFLAEGGDLYTVFGDIEEQGRVGKVTDVVISYMADRGEISVPERGRQTESG